MSEYSIFTSESVSEGHPDKVADQISDAVLDAIIARDPYARVAVETLVKTGMAVVAGEVTTSCYVDLEDIVRDVITGIGYNSSDVGFDGATCAVLNGIGKQSVDINMGVDRAKPEDQGAGDQGLMFGYATNETPTLMPAPVYYAHLLVQRQSELRRNGTLPWLRPDAKSQVTINWEGDSPKVDAVVLSTQHDPNISLDDLREAVLENIIKPVLPAEWLHEGNFQKHSRMIKSKHASESLKLVNKQTLRWSREYTVKKEPKRHTRSKPLAPNSSILHATSQPGAYPENHQQYSHSWNNPRN